MSKEIEQPKLQDSVDKATSKMINIRCNYCGTETLYIDGDNKVYCKNCDGDFSFLNKDVKTTEDRIKQIYDNNLDNPDAAELVYAGDDSVYSALKRITKMIVDEYGGIPFKSENEMIKERTGHDMSYYADKAKSIAKKAIGNMENPTDLVYAGDDSVYGALKRSVSLASFERIEPKPFEPIVGKLHIPVYQDMSCSGCNNSAIECSRCIRGIMKHINDISDKFTPHLQSGMIYILDNRNVSIQCECGNITKVILQGNPGEVSYYESECDKCKAKIEITYKLKVKENANED